MSLSKEVLREMIAQSAAKTPGDIQSYLKEIFKDMIQEMLELEMESKLGYAKNDRESKNTDNRRNGYSNKTVKSQLGNIELDIPRDRKGDFNPEIVPKNKIDISGIEDKVISLYSRGMSTRDIHDQLKDLYGIEVSSEMVSIMTKGIIEKAKEWQIRSLDSTYTFVFMDAIHYKVREDNTVKTKAAYVVIGVNVDGEKEILGIWIGENESSKFWLNVLSDLKNRGVNDVLIFSVDGLAGFKEAISASFPNSVIQRCIIHQLRNSFKYVYYKHNKEFAKDFKTVYTAINEEAALEALKYVSEKWEEKYPSAIRTWRNNWDVLSPFFRFPSEIRRIMYTTNVIESLHRQFRKVTKAKSIFPSDESLLKMLYLASENAQKKWTKRYPNWDIVKNQLAISFEGRI